MYKNNYITTECTKGSTIELDRIENSDIYSLEIFPSNQSDDSFQEQEFHTFINMGDYSSTNRINVDYINYPTDWTQQDKEEFWKTIKFIIDTQILIK